MYQVNINNRKIQEITDIPISIIWILLNLIFIDKLEPRQLGMQFVHSNQTILHHLMTVFIFLQPAQQRATPESMNNLAQRNRNRRTLRNCTA